MSEFIFDQIYGSQAKKKKIMQNNNFIYYRQMMKIKNTHIKNHSLYQHLYHVPVYNNEEEISSVDQYNDRQIKVIRNKNPFFTLNQNQYTIQKINTHAFKILKRNNKNSVKSSANQVNLKSWAHEKGYPLGTHRRLESRTIDSDAKRLRSYLLQSQAKSPTKLRNLSVQLQSSRTPRTFSKFDSTDRQTSAFSSINRSDLHFKKY